MTTKGNGFIMLNPKENLIHEKKCKFCRKYAQYFRHSDDKYVCKEHLFD